MSVAPPSVTNRFIPAGAGNAVRIASAPAADPVHPRGRGERPIALPDRVPFRGSSPRARGTRMRAPRHLVRGRFIPAGAGNARPPWRRWPRSAVHPRGRGERSVLKSRVPAYGGSSPRARGTLRRARPAAQKPRFIPAGAGNAPPFAMPPASPPVHPRGRGEREATVAFLSSQCGSSPRARGTLCQTRY